LIARIRKADRMSPGRETTARADPLASDAELAAAFRRDPQSFTAVYDR